MARFEDLLSLVDQWFDTSPLREEALPRAVTWIGAKVAIIKFCPVLTILILKQWKKAVSRNLGTPFPYLYT